MTDLWSIAISDPYQPFTIAFFLMLGIGLIEAIGLGLGEFPDMHVDLDMDGHPEGLSLLSWLGIGAGIPILIWLTSLLACFTIVGFIGQQVITVFFGSPLNEGLAVVGTLVPSFALNTLVANGLARIMPHEETTALQPEDLLGLRGLVINAPARRGRPSRVKVIDGFKQAHYLPVEPHDDHDVLLLNDVVLLVRKEGSMFFGQSDTPSSLRSI